MTAAEPNWTHLQFDKLTMWPTETPGAPQFFAMAAQTPDYQLNTTCTLLGDTVKCSTQELDAHSSKHAQKNSPLGASCHFLPGREVLP